MECKIPEEIRKLQPAVCAKVKLNHNHSDVCHYTAKQLPSGKRGKCFGTSIPEAGFIPNKNDQSESAKEESSDGSAPEQAEERFPKFLLDCDLPIDAVRGKEQTTASPEIITRMKENTADFRTGSP